MPSERRWTVVLVLAGLLLVTNSLWLFPHEGEARYTYDRSEVVIENGSLTYQGRHIGPFDDENDLTPLGCDDPEVNQLRACALDHYLSNHSPITVPGRLAGEAGPDFVRIQGNYYRRTIRRNDTANPPTITLDIERVSARTVRAESAVNISDTSERPNQGVRFDVLLSGETASSFARLSDHALGTIYERNGAYYVVVLIEEQVVDHGPMVHDLRYELPRYLLMTIGFALLFGAYVKRRR